MTNIEKAKVLQELFDDIVEAEKSKLKEMPPEDVSGFIRSSIFIKEIIINKEIELVKGIKDKLMEKKNEISF